MTDNVLSCRARNDEFSLSERVSDIVDICSIASLEGFVELQHQRRFRMPTPQEDQAAREHALELAKLEVERAKLQLAREELALEYKKAKWSAISVAVPLLAIAATVALGVWNQFASGQAQFELKVAELTMGAGGPFAARRRAAALAALFPHKLPADFASRFDVSKLPENPEAATNALFTLVTSKPECASEALKLWTLFYPGDRAAAEIANRMSPSPCTRG